MLIWSLTTGEPHLATSLYNSEGEAYRELAQQMFGEESELPSKSRLKRLLSLLAEELALAPERLPKKIIRTFEDELDEIGMTAVVDVHSYA